MCVQLCVCVCVNCPEPVSVARCQVEKVEEDVASPANRTGFTRRGPGLSSQSAESEQELWPKASSYHVRGPVNQVYSEILLSRLCPKTRS